jgi:hypothetical protein
LLHSHYRNFIAPTGCSVPVLRIGTLILGDLPLGFLPWHRSDRFPCSLQKPAIRSRHLYAGHRLGSKQVPPELITEQWCIPVFDAFVHAFDTSSVIRLRSPSYCPPDPIIAGPFPVTLTTPALNRRSLRWFEACSCKPASEGQPPSPVQLSWHTTTQHADSHLVVQGNHRAVAGSEFRSTMNSNYLLYRLSPFYCKMTFIGP